MNRQEFMKQLAELLRDIPANERRDALNYYENYFEDAGAENEGSIIEELESPQKVATTIKKDLFGENYGAYVYMNQEQKENESKKEEDKTLRNVLIVIAVVVTCPLWLAAAAALMGIILGLLGVVFGFAVAVIAVVGAFLLAGCILIGVGIVKVFAGFPAVGLIVIGVGMLLLAGFVVGLLLVVWTIGTFIPWAVSGISKLCKMPFEKRKENAK